MINVLDLMVAIEELVENEKINQFDELNFDVIKRIFDKANEIANEE